MFAPFWIRAGPCLLSAFGRCYHNSQEIIMLADLIMMLVVFLGVGAILACLALGDI